MPLHDVIEIVDELPELAGFAQCARGIAACVEVVQKQKIAARRRKIGADLERARVTGTQVSGLGTLLSGAHIALDPVREGKSARSFKGLEEPPIVTFDQPGRQFTLLSWRAGAPDVATPVYFRKMRVGEVVASELDPSGDFVTTKVFVNAPFDARVTNLTISEGAYAHVGQQMFVLIDARRWWASRRTMEETIHEALVIVHFMLGSPLPTFFANLVGVNQQGTAFVHMHWGNESGQLTPDEARTHATHMIETATAAEFDAKAFAVLHEQMGMPVEAAAQFLVMMREARGENEGASATRE